MANEITAEHFSPFLAELGYSMPAVAVTAILARINGIGDCLDMAGHDPFTVQLIQLYAGALMAISTGARRLQSQGAPSGASRSFNYNDDAVQWLRDSLERLDTHGCTADLPISAGESVGFFMVVGGRDD